MPKAKKIADHYFSGEYYDKVYVPTTMNFQRSIRWMANYYKLITDIFPEFENYKNKNIVEIGSSYGGLIEILNRKGFKHVVASDTHTRLWPKELKNKFLQIDLLNSKIKNEYDIILALGCMEHIDDSEKAIDTLTQMLKKNGVVIIAVPYPLKKHLFDQYHTNMQYPHFYTNLFNRRNYSLLEVKNVTFIPYIWRLGIPGYINGLVQTNLAISDTIFVFKRNF